MKKIQIILRSAEYTLLAIICYGLFAVGLAYTNDQQSLTTAVGILVVAGLFLIVLKRSAVSINKEIKKENLGRSLIYTQPETDEDILQARAEVLHYCEGLIVRYTRLHMMSGVLHFILQVTTIILTAVTPILVMAAKLTPGNFWLDWLPVIFPALASVIASVLASFPLQQRGIAAQIATEQLKAEREKFLLGATPEYSTYEVMDVAQRRKKLSCAAENFVVRINEIRLSQVASGEESSDDNGEGGKSEDKTGQD